MAQLPSLELICQKLDDHVARFEEHSQKMEEALFGNGKLGLVIRVDRLEQIDDSRKRSFSRIWTAIIGSFTAILGSWGAWLLK